VRPANINHLLRLPALSVRNIPVQGGTATLNPFPASGTHGPSWRMVVELGDEIRAWATYPGGQSGNPLSDRYRDRIPQWANGELDAVRLPRTPSTLRSEQRRETLTLSPRR
jgi:penicillin amidase